MTLEEALEARGLSDPRPLCREILKQLRDSDAAAYREAVRRYEEELAPEEGGEGSGQARLAAWLDYGLWLARRLDPGRAVAVDDSGRAVEADGPPSDAPLLLHLPDKRSRRALVVAAPREPSPAQEATRELLAG